MTYPAESQYQEGLPDFLRSGREMAKAIFEKDWSQSPVGPLENWPQSLRTTVSLCLASNFPISIAWGPSRIQIYNDGYWPICAAKHPQSMGQDFKECWFSAWPVIGEAFERAQGGETSYLENQRMFLDRNRYLEETFFTFSFSPIRDEGGGVGVGGLFHPVTENTARLLAQHRTHSLRDLVARSADSKVIDDACTAIMASLAACELDLPFALLYLFDERTGEPELAGASGLERGTPASPLRLRIDGVNSSSRWPVQSVMEGRSRLVEDVRERFGDPGLSAMMKPVNSAMQVEVQVHFVTHRLRPSSNSPTPAW